MWRRKTSSCRLWETWVSKVHALSFIDRANTFIFPLLQADIPGSDMYMAFGVKDLTQPGAPAQGDVVVGWINTQTGKGGLDDYFLSGAHTCSDGAESCPDTTKPVISLFPAGSQRQRKYDYLYNFRVVRRTWRC